MRQRKARRAADASLTRKVLMKTLKKVAIPNCYRCSVGMAATIGEFRTLTITKDGIATVEYAYSHASSGGGGAITLTIRPVGPKKVTPWDQLSTKMLEKYAARLSWEPLVEMSPLELLAGCSE